MSGRAFVSRFSPNRTNPEVLEAIFVQRHKLADIWLERLRDSVVSEVKHHLLAVGPRGCGKSHLVALLVSRLRKDPAVCERARIAWLPEDETTPSFWKFLRRILRALNAEYGDDFPLPPREQLAAAGNARRAAVLTDYLLTKLDGRTLLVVVENLDDVMRGLKDEGQKRWRAFVQEHPVSATLATSQQLTKDLSGRDRPFFAFFQIEHLQPLTTDDALALLRKIAERTGNAGLAEFLRTPTGRARVRAIRHIAGGGHRVFIILSEFATREKLDDLVTAFEELLDELTPFYQERLRWLPDQQREIVEFLCRQAKTVPVKEIAGELFLSEQTAAAQLKALKEKGYVTAGSVGRESRYELAEPLMRLCVEVKDPQREPIRLIVEFLRIWYDRAGVEAQLQCLAADADIERRYYQAVLEAHRPDMPSPVVSALNRDLKAARATGDPEEVVRVLVELAATADSLSESLAVARELKALGRNDDAMAAYERAVQMKPDNHFSWTCRGHALLDLGRSEEALAAYDRAIQLEPDSHFAWSFKGDALHELGRSEEALAAYDRAIQLEPDYHFAWWIRGRTQLGVGRVREAVEDLRRAVALNGNPEAVASLAEALTLAGDWDEAAKLLANRLWLPAERRNGEQFLHLPDVIAAIFSSAADRGVWSYRVARLVKIAAKTNSLAHLGDALVRSLSKKVYTEVTADALDSWAGVWRGVAERHPKLSLATRLFGVGLRYLQTKDERVLLDLVQEERSILRDLFRLDDSTDAG
jgi:tetratricopeptide (TPR) repeat protein